jgi:SOS response regulatory protein OraA/RecX
MSSLKEFIKGSAALARDSAQNAIEEEINDAVIHANNKGIEKTAAALYEAGVKDDIIINLLQKHWHIDDDDATEVLRYERTVEFPSRKLRDYLTSQGLNSRDIEDFMTKNKVGIKLRHDPNLWQLTPAELIDAVKENE